MVDNTVYNKITIDNNCEDPNKNMETFENNNVFENNINSENETHSENKTNELNNSSILSKEDTVFFKILLKNIDPNTGEYLNICEESLQALQNIYNKMAEVKQILFVNTFLPSHQRNVVEEYISGYTLQELSTKYNLTTRKLSQILRKSGIARRTFLICNTYKQTLEKIKANEYKENVGVLWTEDEDKKLIEEYTSGLSIFDIAKIHKRKVNGIKSRLVKHKFAPTRQEVQIFYIKDQQ